MIDGQCVPSGEILEKPWSAWHVKVQAQDLALAVPNTTFYVQKRDTGRIIAVYHFVKKVDT